MFEFRLIDDKDKLDAMCFRCITCKKDTGLFLIYSKFEKLSLNLC